MKRSPSPWSITLVVIIISISVTYVNAYNFYRHQSEEVYAELNMFQENVDKNFDLVADNLKEDNAVLRAYNKYQDDIRLSKDTGCVPRDIPAIKGKEDIAALVEKCAVSGTKPMNDLLAFSIKIAQAKEKVIAIDQSIQSIMTNCGKDKMPCEKHMRDRLASLNGFFSPAEPRNVRDIGNKIVTKGKTQLSACFGKETGDFLNDLEHAITDLEDCMKLKNVPIN